MPVFMPKPPVGVVKNGYTVTMRDFYFLRGQSWARVVDGKTKTKVVGWMFKDHLNCNVQATAQPTKRGTAVELKKSGAWTAFSDTTKKGTKVVGMYTANARSTFYVKFFSDSEVPSRVVLEFGDAISGISRVSGQAARSIG